MTLSKATEGAPEINDLFTYWDAHDTCCMYLLEGKKH